MSRSHLPVNSGFVCSCMASATPIMRSSKILDIGAVPSDNPTVPSAEVIHQELHCMGIQIRCQHLAD